VRVPPPHWYISPPTEANDLLLVPPFTHLYGTRLPEISIRKTFDTGSPKPQTMIPLVGRIQGKTSRRSHKNENKSPTHKGMTPPPTQNLTALDLWVFFLVCCLTFSFLPNVGLRLTLEYLTQRYHKKCRSFVQDCSRLWIYYTWLS